MVGALKFHQSLQKDALDWKKIELQLEKVEKWKLNRGGMKKQRTGNEMKCF